MISKFSVESLKIDAVKVIQPFYVEDNRGYFLKSFEKEVFESMGLDTSIYEDFESMSTKGVIRGMHFQTKNPQIKMVRAAIGTIFDVVVDLRKESPTFGTWMGIELSGDNHKSLWVPKGFAHGFQVLSDYALVNYKCVGKYEKGFDSGICFNDKELDIKWHNMNTIISERDKTLQTFECFRNTYGGL